MSEFSTFFDSGRAGIEMYQHMSDLYPICRSITGDGFRDTLRILQRWIPLEVYEVPSGSQILDWIVPKEWNVRDAYVMNCHGEKVIDFQRSNLHLLSYSIPVRRKMSLNELKGHLFSLPEQPDWIPYRTSYYSDNWGFCLSQKSLEALEDGEYEVCIDSSLEPGSLTYGEYIVAGETEEEVLFSCHSCHPSMANDNLSGMVLTACLARHVISLPRRYTYRFLFIPGTIGAIAWLAAHEDIAPRIKHGLAVACVGDSGKMTYKRSRRGNAEIDRAVEHVLKHSGQPYEIRHFSPYGYDERQYCSPGFNLPVGSLGRTPYGCYPEYHTSADNLDLVQPQYLADSLSKYLAVVDLLEGNRTYCNTHPKGEPQLGRRGLYGSLGGMKDIRAIEMAMLWVLNFSDGTNSLLDIAERAGLEFRTVKIAAEKLLKAGLLRDNEGGV